MRTSVDISLKFETPEFVSPGCLLTSVHTILNLVLPQPLGWYFGTGYCDVAIFGIVFSLVNIPLINLGHSLYRLLYIKVCGRNIVTFNVLGLTPS